MTCFYFTEYLQICTISVSGDLVCIQGFWLDPLDGETKYEYFETTFENLYSWLSTFEYMVNGSKTLDKIAAAISDPTNDADLDLGEEILEFHSCYIRLTTLLGSSKPEEPTQAGFYIEDMYLAEREAMSFTHHLATPVIRGIKRKSRQRLIGHYNTMSGHLVALALRYGYYHQSLSDKKLSEPQRLFYASLQDNMVFLAAKAAFDVATFEPEYTVKKSTAKVFTVKRSE